MKKSQNRNDLDLISSTIRFLYPNLRYFDVQKIPPNDDIQISGVNYIARLYCETIYSQFLIVNDLKVLLLNDYHFYFSYELILGWIYVSKQSKGALSLENEFEKITHYSFKRFFSEQLILEINSITSRTMFLESMLYEQQVTFPVMKQLKENSQFALIANNVYSISNSLIMLHEIGHNSFQETSKFWKKITQESFGPNKEIKFIDFWKNIKKMYSKELISEISSDLYAVICIIKDVRFTNQFGISFAINCVLFSYFTQLIFSSLKETVSNIIDSEELENEFVSYLKKDNNIFDRYKENYRDKFKSYIKIDENMRQRVKVVTDFLELISKLYNIPIYEESVELPLPKATMNDLENKLYDVFEKKLVTDSQHALAYMLAGAFGDNNTNMKFLFQNQRVLRIDNLKLFLKHRK